MRTKTIPLSKIKPAPYNPRIDLKPGDEEYEKIKRSIQEFGLVEPLVWNEHNGVLIGGHQRLKVLKEMGHKEVLVSVVDIKDPKREKALNIALNRIQGEFDEDKLAQVIDTLSDEKFDATLTGFGEDEIDELLKGILPPEGFKTVDESLETEVTCPKCGYEFSGGGAKAAKKE